MQQQQCLQGSSTMLAVAPKQILQCDVGSWSLSELRSECEFDAVSIPKISWYSTTRCAFKSHNICSDSVGSIISAFCNDVVTVLFLANFCGITFSFCFNSDWLIIADWFVNADGASNTAISMDPETGFMISFGARNGVEFELKFDFDFISSSNHHHDHHLHHHL